MTSLGLLGEYGSVSSGSEISDSEEEFEPREITRSLPDRSKMLESSLVDKTESNLDKEELNCGTHTDGDPLNFAQGDGDDTSSSDYDEDSDEDVPLDNKDTSIPLPLPNLDQLTGQTSNSSVFSNPFKDAEDAKLALLKKHVTELAPEEKPPSPRSRNKHRKFKGGSARGHRNRPFGMGHEATPIGATPTGAHTPHGFFNDDDSCALVQGKRKHRSGLSSTLVPPKKFMKSYEKSRAEERPWTVNNT